MTCEEAGDLLPLYHYGELEDVDLRALREHMDSCNRCRDELADIQRVLKAVGTREVPDIPEEFWETIAADIIRRIEKDSIRIVVMGRDLGRLRVFTWIAAAAAVVIMLLAVGLVMKRTVEYDVVGVPALEEFELGEIETALAMEKLETEASLIWNREESEAPPEFDVEFGGTLDLIERSVERILVELEDTGALPDGDNGSV